ncbi:MAG: PorV/PorQ family protein [Rhodothermales bacterium]
MAVQAQAPGAFARLGFGARGIAMGNAQVADGSGFASPYYNPALAPLTAQQNLEGTVGLLTLDRELQYLQLAAPLRPRAGVAAGLIHAGVSNIDGRDASGFHTQDYSTDEYMAFLAFGLRVSERVSWGLSMQLFRADLFDDLTPVNSIGLDVGLSVQVSDALRLGFVADDLLARYSWDTSGLYGNDGKTTSDRFATRLRLGASYTMLDDQLRIVGEVESSVANTEVIDRRGELLGNTLVVRDNSERLLLQDTYLRVGAEYILTPAFAVRSGFDRLGGPASGGTSPSAGFMVEQGLGNLLLRVDYAFTLEPYAVSAMHLLTLKVFL